MKRTDVLILRELEQAKDLVFSLDIVDAVAPKVRWRSSVYAEMARLQKEGLVTAYWDESGEHPRRKFGITPAGMRHLGKWDGAQ